MSAIDLPQPTAIPITGQALIGGPLHGAQWSFARPFLDGWPAFCAFYALRLYHEAKHSDLSSSAHSALNQYSVVGYDSSGLAILLAFHSPKRLERP
jgi:hypothetical protein